MNVKILNKRQEAKLNSFDLLIEYFDENPLIVNENAAFKAAVEEVKPLIAEVKAKAPESAAVTEGITTGKRNLKDAVVNKTAAIGGSIYAFAAKNGNDEMKAAVSFTKTELKTLKDGELALRCQALHDLALANRAELEPFGVTTAKLTELQTAIDNYAQSVPKPRAAITSRSVLKAEIKQLFVRLDSIFDEQLDKLVENFTETHPSFAANYRAKRKIIDPRRNKKKNGENPIVSPPT
ncbi:MAG: hypothetical protein LUM44_10420 [Pyrinomonadaceae bacterium]|nr:hypothetical protein [Pyrinomonadaceae bacterium]